jgi:hypothetical protein
MAIPHKDIMIRVIPDEYHIRFAGKKSDGKQVFVTADLKYDPAIKKTTDCDHRSNSQPVPPLLIPAKTITTPRHHPSHCFNSPSS